MRSSHKTRRLRFRWAAAMAMMVVTLSFGAHAQGDGAAREFEKGMEFFRRGAHDEAARSFYAAYRASPHPDSLYNAGLAWELAGELAKAATAFEISLGLTLRQKAREDATRRLRSLARELGRVEVSVPEGSTLRVLGFVIRSPSSVVYLEPGKQRLGVTLPDGSSADRRVVAEAGATTVVLVELPREDSASSSAAPQEPLPQPPRAESQSSTTETIGWVSLGVAAAASVAAVVLGIEALRARDDYEGSRNTDRDARRKAEDLRLWTNVAWGTAALTGGGGAVILLTLPPKDAQAGLPVSGVAVRGRF